MDIIFWSGGKDAYLALEFYRREHPNCELCLLTTYDETTEIVPHQNISLTHIRKQAADLSMDLLTVPLPPKCSNKIYLQKVEQALTEQNGIEHLIFGDWHLQDIRDWRENVFSEMGYQCLFPLWEKSIHELLPVLQLKPVEVEISAVSEEFQDILKVGEPFDQSLIIQLQHLPKIDPMGENGEFHTKVTFKDLDDIVQ